MTAGSRCDPSVTVSRSEDDVVAVEETTDTSATDSTDTSTDTTDTTESATSSYSKGSASGSRIGSRQTFYQPGGTTRAVLISGDRVLLIGNGDRARTGNRCWTQNGCSEIYTQSTNTWASTGEMPFGAYLYGATVLANGNVLIAGGYGSATADKSSNQFSASTATALYDTAAGTWASAGVLTAARYGGEMIALPSGGAMMCGGFDGSNVLLSTCETWDGSSTWVSSTPVGATVLRSTPQFLQFTSELFMLSGYGASTNIYNSTSQTWATVPAGNSLRSNSRLAVVEDGSHHVITAGQPTLSAGNVAKYDGALFTTKSNMATAMQLPGLISDSTGTKAYAFGGEENLASNGCNTNGGGSKVTQSYNIGGDSWANLPLAAMTYTRCDPSVVRFSNGKIAVIGGRAVLQGYQTEELIEIFNPTTELFE